MSVLVTGAQGFLGREIVGELKRRGVQVIATGRRSENGIYQCDLLDCDSVKVFIDQWKPCRIVHCAATVPRKSADYHNEGFAQHNLCMMESISAASTCPIIYVSSMTVYGDALGRPVVEEDAGAPKSAYGRSKLMGEAYLRDRNRSGWSVRIPGLFGPPRREGLVFNLLNAAKHNRYITLPSEAVSWAGMHVKDAARGIVSLALSPDCPGHAINLGYRGPQSIKRLVAMISSQYQWENEYSVKQPDFEFDLTRAEELGVLPRRGLREALIDFGTSCEAG